MDKKEKSAKELSEEEILELCNKIKKYYRYKYRFGYMEPEDVDQEVYLLVQDGINRYDPSKGKLLHFLRRHVRNRLMTMKRDKQRRIDKPCLECPLWRAKDNYCTKFGEAKLDCEEWKNWELRNQAKENILLPIPLYTIDDEKESNTRTDTDTLEEFATQEMIEWLDQNLEGDLRSDWIMIKMGHNFPSIKKAKIMEKIKLNLIDAGFIDVT